MHCGESHACHTGVVHGRYAGAHQQTASRNVQRRYPLATDDVQCDKRGQHGGQERDGHGWKVVVDRDGQAEGQHSRVMHSPDPTSHGKRASGQPRQTGATSACSHASGQVYCCIGGENRYHYRNHYQAVVVGWWDAGEVSHFLTFCGQWPARARRRSEASPSVWHRTRFCPWPDI